ncbi:hypothetical protein [Gloeothece verrucosa]|uniref:Uncharacterized protein n=1 Tax=Gloeothece verrucosa (strain PCC 7822) TaxID=497965 RepID=E0UMI0_GLOV7|nr:hypothetical protein [Gloeothece verrucosa]ADN18160.1 conserved hypothetical protein [Gloeothece verrucosa PCC 7822]
MANLYIHEFSTGIQVDGDGRDWVSRGFTGDYMNKTLNPIPTAIHSAITNREFAVAEGASREDPAIIGREIEGTTERWSVVAVVTRGRDDRGRSVSLYRYFLAEGLGHLTDILCWLRTQGGLLIFDPFDIQTIRQPHQYDTVQTSNVPIKSELQNLLHNEAPIIIPYNQPCTPLIIDAMAKEKSRGIEAIAWAYKVEALETPTRFQVIQAVSEKAEQLLQKAKTTTPKLSTVVAEEGQIKTAIKGLMSREKPKLDQLKIFDSALKNSKIDDNYWKIIFDSQGAKDALSQGIYSASMVRLMTLQAIARPTHLFLFLGWMQKRENQSAHYEVSERFQQEVLNTVRGQCSEIDNRITEGVRWLIANLINYPDQVEPAVWLFKLNTGLWGNAYQTQLKQKLKDDFNFKKAYPREYFSSLATNNHLKFFNNKAWEPILDDLDKAWNSNNIIFNKEYLPIAQLFENLEDYSISIFFYYLAQELVPKEVFDKAEISSFRVYIYGIHISREVTDWEEALIFIQKIGGQIVPVYFVLTLLILFTGLGFGGGYLIGNKTAQNASNFHNDNIGQIPEKIPNAQASNSSPKPTSSANPSQQTFPSPKVTQKPSSSKTTASNQSPQPVQNELTVKIKTAVNQFESKDKTKESLEGLAKEFITVHNIKKEDVENAIAQALAKNLNFQKKNTNPEKEEWVKAIINYQAYFMQAKEEHRDGIIQKNGNTYNTLKCDIAQNYLKIKLLSKPDICTKNTRLNPPKTI